MSVLNEIAGSAQTANLSTNASLWNWGDNPMGYTINQSGQLIPIQNVLLNDFGGWVPSV
jgi:alpha-tubulin suppressor-like RCC1 family protein